MPTLRQSASGDCGLCVVLIPICWSYTVGREMILVSENDIVIIDIHDMVLVYGTWKIMHEPFVRANQGIVDCGLNTVCWSKVIRRNIIRSNKEVKINWLKEKRSLTP